MKLNLFNKLIFVTLFILCFNAKLFASEQQVIFQVPAQIDYPGDFTPRIDCLVRLGDTIQGAGHVGGIPNVHVRKTINVRVRAYSGKRFTKGMKYECYLDPKGRRDDTRVLSVGNLVRLRESQRLADNAKRAVLKVSGRL